MYSDKFNKLTEAAHIGEELETNSAGSEMERKCLVIQQVVRDGDFSLEEALALYEVSQDDFEKFVARDLTAQLRSSVITFPTAQAAVAAIDIMAEMYKVLLMEIDIDAATVLQHLQSLSKKVNEGKVNVSSAALFARSKP